MAFSRTLKKEPCTGHHCAQGVLIYIVPQTAFKEQLSISSFHLTCNSLLKTLLWWSVLQIHIKDVSVLLLRSRLGKSCLGSMGKFFRSLGAYLFSPTSASILFFLSLLSYLPPFSVPIFLFSSVHHFFYLGLCTQVYKVCVLLSQFIRLHLFPKPFNLLCCQCLAES